MPLHTLADGQSLYYELTGTGPHTLVLLNGRRLTSSPGGSGVDTNLLPTAAIGRINGDEWRI